MVDIDVDAREYLLKSDKPKRSDVTKSKRFSLKIVDTNNVDVVDILDREAVISVAGREYKIPKSVYNDFKRIYGKDKPGKLEKSIRFKLSKKPGIKTLFVSDIWEKGDSPSERDAVAIGENIALFLSGESRLVDVTGFGLENVPFKFYEKRKRIPEDIAFNRGYNVSSNKDLRLNSEGKVLGELMYRCERIFDKEGRDGTDICFGVKIREEKGRFFAESIIRSIDREFGEVSTSRRTIPKVVVKNKNVTDFVLLREEIDSPDILEEANEVFDNLYLEDIKRSFRFFDVGITGRKSSFLSKHRAIIDEEIRDFNSFVDSSVKERSNLDKSLIKREFANKLEYYYKKTRGVPSSALVKTFVDLYNDKKVLDSNKTANNPFFYKKLNSYIAKKVIENAEIKEDISFMGDEFD